MSRGRDVSGGNFPPKARLEASPLEPPFRIHVHLTEASTRNFEPSTNTEGIQLMARKITYKGETKSITEWSLNLGIPVSTFRKRLNLGWSLDKIMETPTNQNMNGNSITWKGKTQTLTAWSVELDIPVHTLWKRLNKGWSMDEAFLTPVRAYTKRRFPKVCLGGKLPPQNHLGEALSSRGKPGETSRRKPLGKLPPGTLRPRRHSVATRKGTSSQPTL